MRPYYDVGATMSDVVRFAANTVICVLAFVGIAFWIYVAISAWRDGIYGLFTMSTIILGLFAVMAVRPEGGDDE